MTRPVDLLSRFVTEHDESAFTELGTHHLDHVYSTVVVLLSRETLVTHRVFRALAHQAGVRRNKPQ